MDENALSTHIAAWINDLAGHVHAAARIGALGNAAIPGIADYLARGPQAVPHARRFAVARLARLCAPAATDALRAVLHSHPLHGLAPPYAESEYVVKCDASQALASRTYAEREQDVAFGVHERLRVAVAAAGRLGLLQLTSDLADLLDDDVLADTAMDALVALGARTSAVILPRLDAWLTEAVLSARRRLAVIRALRVMYRLHTAEADAAIRRAQHAPHPAVRAAASLLVQPPRRDDPTIESLLHGALGFDYGLALDCRNALEDVGRGLLEPTLRALEQNAEPNLYGQLLPLCSERRDWLVRRRRRYLTDEP